MSKAQIMKHVDILELIRIHVFRIPNTPKFEVEIECIERDKNLVFDEDALRVMNHKITEKAAQFEARDPRAKNYIEEFVARLTSELHRNGLVELEEVPESAPDPYADMRRKYK